MYDKEEILREVSLSKNQQVHSATQHWPGEKVLAHQEKPVFTFSGGSYDSKHIFFYSTWSLSGTNFPQLIKLILFPVSIAHITNISAEFW